MTEIKRAAGLGTAARVTLLAGLIAAPVMLLFNLLQVAAGVNPGNVLAITLFDFVPLAAALALAYWYVARHESERSAAAAARETALLARLDGIVDSAMDAIITVDEAQKIVLFNRAAEQVFRMQRDQALGEGLDRFLPQRFRAAHRGHIEHFGRTGVTSRRMGDVTILWALRADGEEFPIEASISQAAEGGRPYFTVILRDITLRKQAEDELKHQQQELRELSARVLEVREEEKTLIARELHDELGQLLTALKMDLAWLRERLPAGDAEIAARAGEMGALLDRTVASTRRISADLRPLMLDDLGLADAAQWLVDDFAKRSEVKCELRMDGIPGLDVSKAVAIAVYRALQESLTNISRHSGAANAWIALEAQDGAIRLEIEDNGRGIAPQDVSKRRSLGLKGMQERFSYLGGSFDVARAPRGGTRVCISVPARPAEPPA